VVETKLMIVVLLNSKSVDLLLKRLLPCGNYIPKYDQSEDYLTLHNRL